MRTFLHLPCCGALVAGLLAGAGALEAQDVPESAGTWHRGSFVLAGLTRSYREYRPASARDGPPAGLVLLLHGCTQDAADIARGTRIAEHAEVRRWVVVVPEQPAAAHAQRCWQWYDAAHQAADAGEAALLAALAREAALRHRVDPERRFVAGLSAGGAMALVLAARHPRLFRAVAVHSAVPFGAATTALEALAAMRQPGPGPGPLGERLAAALPGGVRHPPVLVIHGAADAVVHPDNGWRIAAQLAAVRRPPVESLVTHEGDFGNPHGWRRVRYHSEGELVAEVWLIEGLGHAWSGGAASGSYTDPRGPDATAAIVTFFAERAR